MVELFKRDSHMSTVEWGGGPIWVGLYCIDGNPFVTPFMPHTPPLPPHRHLGHPCTVQTLLGAERAHCQSCWGADGVHCKNCWVLRALSDLLGHPCIERAAWCTVRAAGSSVHCQSCWVIRALSELLGHACTVRAAGSSMHCSDLLGLRECAL